VQIPGFGAGCLNPILWKKTSLAATIVVSGKRGRLRPVTAAATVVGGDGDGDGDGDGGEASGTTAASAESSGGAGGGASEGAVGGTSVGTGTAYTFNGTVAVPLPGLGWRGFFVQLTFPYPLSAGAGSARRFIVSTQVGVVPTAYPFEDCTTDGSSCKGVIV
jgi:hypothetical protein